MVPRCTEPGDLQDPKSQAPTNAGQVGKHRGRHAYLAPVAIGLTLVFSILMGGALTGAAFNPARAGSVTRPGRGGTVVFLNNCYMICEHI